ncbi:hypothetical protein AQ611_22800 [Burkholderia singularis]|nr:hypothetical protein AQ611_22800 [Burkholderia sp. Bp7605]
MRTIFEAVGCYSPYPVKYFDDISWRQFVIKAVFIDVPLWQINGIGERLSPELAHMALDLVDERRSAGRDIPPQLWFCLGPYLDDRGMHALQNELMENNDRRQRGALLALGRAGALTEDRCQRAVLTAHAPFIQQARADGFTQRMLEFL